MQENSYIQVLIQSLHQKVEALDSIIEKNKEQYEILSAEEADMDAFEKNIDEKSQYIDKIVFLDDGFEEIYTRVKEELDGNRAAYTEEIQKMKEAYYYFIHFESDAETPSEIEQRIRIMDNVIRFLCVRQDA